MHSVLVIATTPPVISFALFRPLHTSVHARHASQSCMRISRIEIVLWRQSIACLLLTHKIYSCRRRRAAAACQATQFFFPNLTPACCRPQSTSNFLRLLNHLTNQSGAAPNHSPHNTTLPLSLGLCARSEMPLLPSLHLHT
jgi:hypothetical protein